jgi:hypothetical protein
MKVGCVSGCKLVTFHDVTSHASQKPSHLRQVGVAPVKSPKIIFAQTPLHFSGCPVDKIDPNFYKKKIPEVPRWVHQRRILYILLVTGLVTHI